MPKRVQRHRGKALPPGVKYVGRPSHWGCPYVFRERDLKPGRTLVGSRQVLVERYETDLRADPARVELAHQELGGLDLACYCPLDVDCHADVLLRVANEG